ncbi:MAG TPA: DUF1573 domain-containing protein [Chitinophagales bacterium]|nr:DUF1573 domain-containing protein [Chitinophagales bacterium]
MNKLLLFASALIFSNFILSAQTSDPNAPVMSFEFEKYDFGDIKEGEEASVDFVFTNTGKKNLVITDVVASCSCTASSWPKEPVAPGQKATITASYDTKGKSGSFNKSITITSNAREETKRIFIKGNVISSGGNSASGSEKKTEPATFDE